LEDDDAVRGAGAEWALVARDEDDEATDGAADDAALRAECVLSLVAGSEIEEDDDDEDGDGDTLAIFDAADAGVVDSP
jgi:hypothetical protein